MDSDKQTTENNEVTPRQPKYLLIATVVVAIGAGVSFVASTGSQLAWEEADSVPLIALAAALSFVINWIAFVPAEILKTEHFFDLTGSLTYLSLVWSSCLVGGYLRGGIPPRQWLVTVMVTIWAVRLGSFLLNRIRKAGKDGRFDELKKDSFRFFNIWTIQGLWCFFTAVGAIVINCSTSNRELVVNDYVGIAIWSFGFLIEVISDQQKTNFCNNPENKGKWIDQGLWYYSRHPNYFGEIVLWLGIAIMGTSIYQDGEWVSFLSPVFVTFLLTKVSGLPMLESRADEKWGHLPEYQQYKQSTSVIVILPKGRVVAEAKQVDDQYVAFQNEKV